MNYEELLESRNAASMKKETMPFGNLYKKMSGNTYSNVIDLRPELADNLRFCEALKTECEQNKTISDRHQVHFDVTADSSGIYGVTLEKGNLRTFAKLLEEKPAIVAEKHFVDNTMKALVEMTESLNDQGIYHLCFAPSNILVRKGDNTPMLLFHGSSYLLLNDQEMLYEGVTDFVAPEVLEDGVGDARSEVYSMGRLMEYLYRDSDVPYEYRKVIKKATDANPENRYADAAAMLRAMTSRRSLRNSLLLAVASLVIALLCVGAYMEFLPSQESVEFVESAPKEDFGEEMYPEEHAEGYDPIMDLGLPQTDSTATHVDEKKMKEYEAKAEQIFRKRYTAEAERILSRIYDNEHMNVSEKKFMSESSSVIEELTKKQIELGNEAGLSNTKSQHIASEIIDKISNAKKSKLQSGYGVQKETE